MRNIFTIMLVIFLAFCYPIFSQFEVGLNIPLGFGVTFENTTMGYRETPPPNKPISIDGYLNIEMAALVQVGYNFNFTNVKNLEGAGLFFETGYYLHSFNTKNNHILEAHSSILKYSSTEVMFFHSINIGIIPKLNFKNSSIGIGGGVKIPVAGFTEIYDQYSSMENLPDEEVIKNSYSDLKKTFKHVVVPYIKMTSEFRFTIKDKRFAPTLGVYLSYDFGISYKTDELNKDLEMFDGSPYFKKYAPSAYSVGIQFGVSFR